MAGRPVIDIVGQKFNRLTVKEFSFLRNGYSHWVCLCDCGNTLIVRRCSLKSGNTKSCGCLKKELDLEMYVNGCRDHPGAYNSWSKMIARCTNKSHSAYKWYGGKGVVVDARWLDFRNFVEDMGDRPDGHSIERIDNSAGYSKENCKWIPISEQQWNTSRNLVVTVNGVRYCAAEAAKKFDVPYPVLQRRIKNGWPHDLAISTKGRSCVKPKQ